MVTDPKKSNLANQFREILIARLPIWLIPTVVIGSLGTLYAFVRSPSWKAWQVLHVRDEINSTDDGRFDSNDARKAAQETVLELARSRAVIEAALNQLEPPRSLFRLTKWPSSKEIAAVQDAVAVVAPKGAEFGKTDVLHLTVKSDSPESACTLNKVLGEQLFLRMQKYRTKKTAEIIKELEEKLRVTKTNLNLSTKRLEAMEKQVGSDLGELRSLDRTGSGESNLRTTLTQIETDLRAAQKERTAQQELYEILKAARDDSDKLVATPSEMLARATSLSSLRAGLVEAQLRIAQLSGKMSESHPILKAAIKAEKEVRNQLRIEIPAALNSVAADLKVTDALTASLRSELNEVQNRLSQLAILRAPYSNLLNEVQHHTEQLRQVRESLANAQAAQGASKTSSLLTRVGEIEVGDSPVGLGKTSIIAGSWCGGFIVGLGLVLVLSPASFGHQPRSSVGRRASDRTVKFGRRANDVAANQPADPAPRNRRASDRDQEQAKAEAAE